MSDTIEDKLNGAWRRERRYVHLRGIAALVPWLVGLFLFDLAADWFLELNGIARFVLLLANLGFLGWLGYRYWVRYLQPYDATRVALQVERLFPNLHNLIVSFIQLGRKDGKVHGAPQLIEAVKQQAVEAVNPLSFSGIVDFTRLRKPLAAAATVMFLFAVSGVFAGEYYGTLLERLLNPFSGRIYPTNTKIHDVTGDLVVRMDAKIELSARAGGEVPEVGELRVRYAQGGWETIRLEGDDSTFLFKENKATRGFSYYFRIGDAKSEEYVVKVVAPPRILSAKVDLAWPAYTEQPGVSREGLQLPPVIEGTSVVWNLRLDQALKAGHLVLLGEGAPQPLPLEVDEKDPRNVRLSVSDTNKLMRMNGKSFKSEHVAYHFRWVEKEHGFTFDDPTRYTLEVLPDQPPVVALISPAPRYSDEKYLITPQKILTVVFEATDDYGLASAAIGYTLNDAEMKKSHPLPEWKEKIQSRTIQASWKIRDTIKELKEGDVLVCEVEVSDNRTGSAGPNVGRSRSIRLQVVSEDEYQRFVEKERTAGLDRTRSVLKDEIEGKAKVKLLILNPKE